MPVRVCNDCFSHLKKGARRQSINSLNSSSSLIKRTNWILNASDEGFNHLRRSEFLYESAPSVTLCLAILRLHSDKKRSCKFTIDRICAPLLESTSSKNVDSTLLIEMIRSLLISTRIFIERYYGLDQMRLNETNQEIEQLNLYLDRLDVIRMMINSNYGTKEMISFVLNNNIQKLQERLLEMERFELAIDIAKKYGLDSSSIWKTWALICLKHFQFSEARRKFTRYFDQAKRFSEIQLTLKSIVNILVNNNLTNHHSVPIKNQCQQIISGTFDFLRESIDIEKSTAAVKQSNRQQLNSKIFEEIVYYLQEYGTYDDLLRFYVNHFYWNEAVKYFLSNNQDSTLTAKMNNSFLQDLFIPAQVKGCLSLLFAAIRKCDPQLNHLWAYLISTCKYLDKNSFYNSLCRVQAFMNDYLRAAITQINCFFLSQLNELQIDDIDDIELNSFDLLHYRIGHLEKARDYCNMYLHNMDYVNIRSGCLSVEKKDVFKQIRLIEFQIEILKRFKMKNVSFPTTVHVDSLDSLLSVLNDSGHTLPQPIPAYTAYVLHTFQTELALKISSSLYPPTFLEHDTNRKSLIVSFIILHFCDTIEEGFRYSLRIIQVCKWPLSSLLFFSLSIFVITNFTSVFLFHFFSGDKLYIVLHMSTWVVVV